MKEIRNVFEFWKEEKHMITIAFERTDKACFIELERLIEMTGLSYELIPRLIGSSMRQLFYKPGDFIEHWGSICKKGEIVTKHLEFEYTDMVKVLQRELKLVPFKIGDFIAVNGNNIEVNPIRHHVGFLEGLNYYWDCFEESGENTMEVIRYIVKAETLEFKLVCKSYKYIEERSGKFRWQWYDPEFYVNYQFCRTATEKEVIEYKEKEDNFHVELREASKGEEPRNHKKDTFDALTDGQYGDYDDFEGDIDIGSVKDDLGLD